MESVQQFQGKPSIHVFTIPFQGLFFIPVIALLFILGWVAQTNHKEIEVQALRFELPDTWHSSLANADDENYDTAVDGWEAYLQSLQRTLRSEGELEWIASKASVVPINITLWQYRPNLFSMDVDSLLGALSADFSRELDLELTNDETITNPNNVLIRKIELKSDGTEDTHFGMTLIGVDTFGRDYFMIIFGNQTILQSKNAAWQKIIETLKVN